MPQPRTPNGKAKVTGAAGKNSQRFRDRKEPKGTKALGDAPSWFDERQAAVWEGFKRELPWITESDRALLEMASILRATFQSSPVDFGATKLNLLRLCLAQLGATPADRTKVSVPDGEDEDPTSQFFN